MQRKKKFVEKNLGNILKKNLQRKKNGEKILRNIFAASAQSALSVQGGSGEDSTPGSYYAILLTHIRWPCHSWERETGREVGVLRAWRRIERWMIFSRFLLAPRASKNICRVSGFRDWAVRLAVLRWEQKTLTISYRFGDWADVYCILSGEFCKSFPCKSLARRSSASYTRRQLFSFNRSWRFCSPSLWGVDALLSSQALRTLEACSRTALFVLISFSSWDSLTWLIGGDGPASSLSTTPFFLSVSVCGQLISFEPV